MLLWGSLCHHVTREASRLHPIYALGRELDNTVRFGGARKRPPVDLPLGQFLPGWTYPDAMHVADMLKALPERRTDPEIVAWLGRPDLVASIRSYQKAIG